MLPEDAVTDVEGWLEFEEILRHSLPHALLADKANHIRRLVTSLEGRKFLVGDALSLADIAIYGTLLPTLSKQPVKLHPASVWCPVQQRQVCCISHEMSQRTCQNGQCLCRRSFLLR